MRGQYWPYLVALLQVVIAVSAALANINPFREPMLGLFTFAWMLFLTTVPTHFWIRTRHPGEVIHHYKGPSVLTREFQQKQSAAFSQYLRFHDLLSLISVALVLGVIFLNLILDMRPGTSNR